MTRVPAANSFNGGEGTTHSAGSVERLDKAADTGSPTPALKCTAYHSHPRPIHPAPQTLPCSTTCPVSGFVFYIPFGTLQVMGHGPDFSTHIKTCLPASTRAGLFLLPRSRTWRLHTPLNCGWWWCGCKVTSVSCDPVDCSLPDFSDHGTLQRDHQSNHSCHLTQFSSTIHPGKPLIFCQQPLVFTNMATLSLLNFFFSQLIFNWMITMCEGLPWWLRWARTCLWCGRPRFHVWIRKISWRREWKPPPALLPGGFHGQRSLVCLWGCKELDTTEWLALHFSLLHSKSYA